MAGLLPEKNICISTSKKRRTEPAHHLWGMAALFWGGGVVKMVIIDKRIEEKLQIIEKYNKKVLHVVKRML